MLRVIDDSGRLKIFLPILNEMEVVNEASAIGIRFACRFALMVSRAMLGSVIRSPIEI